jgi:2-keto-4-pentenoate hydratase
MGLSTEEQTLFEAIRQARASMTPIPSHGESWGVDITGAYRVQTALGSGRPLKGYKLGLISPAKQAQMGLTTPIWGRVYADMLLDEVVSLKRFLQPRLEPELAVVLAEALPEEASLEAIWQAIEGFCLVVDILDTAWQGYRFAAVEVIADNSSGGGFVLGNRLGSDKLEGNLRLFLNGRLATEGPIESLGKPVERLRWLANAVGGLEVGQIVFLGSPAAAVPAEPGVLEIFGPDGTGMIVKLAE